MSLYKKAWLFTGFNVLVLIGLYFGLPVLDRVLGTFGLLVFGFYILGQGLIAMAFFSCPQCGLSPFMGSQGLFSSYSPFPRKKCGHCGHDHTKPEVSQP
ncbi:hypothetical protein NDQ41_14400 [Alcaligenes faecalis]|jgi:ribosomal protein S27AE|uniref:hypothetical protein n=1 Tax=Alcaligenes TaxID=507 RepID=UPI00052B836A|nr:hypothetical protein [Alcaligenes faecalis]KGP00209.1 hypothetical protein JT27_18915 [Alcaligenes faecalis]MCM2559892.1 hypothetical protein [Alcaligenes faecalis]MCM2621673.1 hypothetical protein [Alcaligenes faecalis]MDK7585749.1 hypothetical protein [Alcaligenes phenolicus]